MKRALGFARNDLREKYGINLEAYIDQVDSEYEKNIPDEEYEQISFIEPYTQITKYDDKHVA